MTERNEIRYQVIMSIARKLFDEGVITREVYEQFDTEMQKKYSPTWSRLFTDLSLDIT